MQNQIRIIPVQDQAGVFQLQLDLNITMTDAKRQNILANLIMKNSLDLLAAIASAKDDEIEETYNRLNPVRQTEAPIQEAEVVDLQKAIKDQPAAPEQAKDSINPGVTESL